MSVGVNLNNSRADMVLSCFHSCVEIFLVNMLENGRQITQNRIVIGC